MGQIQFIGSMLLAMLFATAIFSYVYGFGNDNDVAFNINSDSEFTATKTNLTTDVQTFRSETNSSLKALFESKVESGDETTLTGGQFKGNVGGVFGGVKRVLSIINNKIFGGEQGDSGFGIILTAIISFLGFVLGLYIWKTWAGKTPD